MTIRTRYQEFADRQLDQMEEAPPRPGRVPLTTNQHILHLILTIVTCGLWGFVWFARAWRGNPAPR